MARDDEQLEAMYSIYACLAYLENETLDRGLRDCARFVHLAMAELQSNFRAAEDRRTAEDAPPRRRRVR